MFRKNYAIENDATGLGLFLSRAFMRSFGGDLRYEHPHAEGDPASGGPAKQYAAGHPAYGAPGCCFVIELALAGDEEE